MRAGESPESVAESTGWPLDRVSRYADPPLGERAYVAERAKTTFIHMTRGGATLGEVVQSSTGVTELDWDSFYTDGQWVISASTAQESAHWTFEPTGNTVHPINDIARSWMGLEPIRVTSAHDGMSSDNERNSHHEASASSDTVILENPEPVRLVAVPSPPEETEPEFLISIDTNPVAVDTNPVDSKSNEPSPKTAAKKSKRGRAKVPSWDEILFGGPKNSD